MNHIEVEARYEIEPGTKKIEGRVLGDFKIKKFNGHSLPKYFNRKRKGLKIC
jgi:hypothetical protein